MLHHLDSFDHYATEDLEEIYTQLYVQTGINPGTTTIHASAGRRLTSGLRFQPSQNPPGSGSGCEPVAIVIPTTDPTCIIGFAFRATGAAGSWAVNMNGNSLYPWYGFSTFKNGENVIAYVRSDGQTQIALVPNSNGTLSIYQGDDPGTNTPGRVVLGTTDEALQWGESYYIELKAVIDDAGSGSVELRVNGDPWLQISDVTTWFDDGEDGNVARVGWNEVVLGHLTSGDGNLLGIGGVVIWDYDDLYIADGDDSDLLNDVVDFLGDIQVTWSPPIQDGAETDWDPSVEYADHYLQVDEAPPDDDGSYIESATPDAIDTYVLEAAALPGQPVLAAQVIYSARRVAGGNTAAAAVLREGSTNYPGTARGNTSTYGFQRHIWTKKPSDASTISDTDWAAMQVGLKKVT